MSRRRILLLFAAFLVLLLGSTYVVLRFTGASRALVEGVLSKFIVSPFALKDADVDPTTGRVSMRGVRIGHPSRDDVDVLRADRVDVDVETNPLAPGTVGRVRKVRVDKLDLKLTLAGDESFDLGQVVDLSKAGGSGGDPYPAIEVVDSRLTLRATADAPAMVFTDVHFELRPEEPRGSRMRLTGALTSEGGVTVQVEGSGDLEKGSFRALFETADVVLTANAARPYSVPLADYLQRAAFSGRASKVAMWLQYPPDPGDQATVGARLAVDLQDVRCKPPELPYPIEGGSGKISASTREDGLLQVELSAPTGQGSLQGHAVLASCLSGVPQVDATVQVHDVAVDEKLGHALAALPPAARVWQAFLPSGGTVDADVYLQHAVTGQPPRLGLDLRLHGVDGSFQGFASPSGERTIRFPYQIAKMDGAVQLRGDRLVIQDVEGSRADGGRIRIDGWLDGLDGPPATQRAQIDIEGRELALSEELRAAVDALVDKGGEIWDRFAPTGSTDADVHVRKQAGPDEPDVEVVLRPLGCSVRYAPFPYRVDGITGTIELREGGVVFDLSGHRDETVVEIGGRFQPTATEHGLDSELWMTALQVPLDDGLRSALKVLDPGLDEMWHTFDPEGAVDCRLTVWRQVDQEDYQHDLRLDFKRGSVMVPQFGHRLTELTGSVFVHGSGAHNRLDASVLRGVARLGDSPAKVLVEGTLETDGGPQSADLTFIVRDLDLDDALAQTLADADVLDLATWRVLRPSGRVDLVHHVQRAPGQPELSHRLRLLLRGVRSDATVLPKPLTDLTGEVVLENGAGRFDLVEGRIGTARLMVTDGRFGHDGDRTYVDVTLSSDHLPVDDTFGHLLTGPLRQTFLDRDVAGTVQVNGLRLRYDFATGGDDFDLRFESGEIAAKNLSLQLVTAIHELTGTWSIVSGRVGPDGGEIVCDARGVGFEVAGHACRDTRARLRADPTQITLEDLDLRLHGGVVQGGDDSQPALVYRYADGGSLGFDLHWSGISLADLSTAAGVETPPRGVVSGALKVDDMVAGDVLQMHGNGHIEIRNGKLGEVPLFTAIYSWLAPKNRPQFDGADLAFRFADGVVQVDDLELKSPIMTVHGEGKVDMGGYVDLVLDFPDLFAAAADWLILPRMFNVLTSQVVRFQLFGYLRNLQARPRWMLQGDPPRQSIPPIPAGELGSGTR